MRAEELIQLVRRQPFAPLRVHMTDGTAYDLYHPDQMIVQRQCVDIGVKPDRQAGVVERVERFSLLHVVRVEPLAEASEAPGEDGNGA